MSQCVAVIVERVFSSDSNCSKLVFRCPGSPGRLFHSRGPAAVGLLSLICDCVCLLFLVNSVVSLYQWS